MNSRRDATENDLRSLLLQGLNGSSPAYREFLLKLSQLLRAYVRRQFDRLQKSANDAEDVVQEALLAIHNRRHTYEPDLPVTAWAYAITRYKLIDHLRANNHELQAIPLEEVDSVIDTREGNESGGTDIGSQAGIIEDDLFGRVDSRIGVVTGDPVHFIDIADALLRTGATVLPGSIRVNDDVFAHSLSRNRLSHSRLKPANCG